MLPIPLTGATAGLYTEATPTTETAATQLGDPPLGTTMIARLESAGAPLFVDQGQYITSTGLELSLLLEQTKVGTYYDGTDIYIWHDWSTESIEYQVQADGRIAFFLTLRKTTHGIAELEGLSTSQALPIIPIVALAIVGIIAAAGATTLIVAPDSVRVLVATTAVALGSDDETIAELAAKPIDKPFLPTFPAFALAAVAALYVYTNTAKR